MSVSDRDWLSIRAAARRQDWREVARRADALGWPLVAKHARRAPVERDSVVTIVYALRLDLPDDSDAFEQADHA